MKKIRLSVPLLLVIGRYGMWEYHIKEVILGYDEDLEQQRKMTIARVRFKTDLGYTAYFFRIKWYLDPLIESINHR